MLVASHPLGRENFIFLSKAQVDKKFKVPAPKSREA
jgi:hypothetical protein